MNKIRSKKKVAIFFSGRGSNMRALIDDMQDTEHPGTPELAISNNKCADGLTYCKTRGVETFVFQTEERFEKRQFELDTLRILLERKIDLICLAGFMHILPGSFIKSFNKKILNIHPSILPAFKGLKTHERVLNAGSLIHGATVHGVTEKIDDGPIFGQAIISVPQNADAQVLSSILLPYEHLLYKKVLREQLKPVGEKILIMPGDQTP